MGTRGNHNSNDCRREHDGLDRSTIDQGTPTRIVRRREQNGGGTRSHDRAADTPLREVGVILGNATPGS